MPVHTDQVRIEPAAAWAGPAETAAAVHQDLLACHVHVEHSACMGPLEDILATAGGGLASFQAVAWAGKAVHDHRHRAWAVSCNFPEERRPGHIYIPGPVVDSLSNAGRWGRAIFPYIESFSSGNIDRRQPSSVELDESLEHDLPLENQLECRHLYWVGRRAIDSSASQHNSGRVLGPVVGRAAVAAVAVSVPAAEARRSVRQRMHSHTEMDAWVVEVQESAGNLLSTLAASAPDLERVVLAPVVAAAAAALAAGPALVDGGELDRRAVSMPVRQLPRESWTAPFSCHSLFAGYLSRLWQFVRLVSPPWPAHAPQYWQRTSETTGYE